MTLAHAVWLSVGCLIGSVVQLAAALIADARHRQSAEECAAAVRAAVTEQLDRDRRRRCRAELGDLVRAVSPLVIALNCDAHEPEFIEPDPARPIDRPPP
ncbi:MAG: hypothetical protein WAZ19_08230 [Anaerolineae bacterium]